MPDADDPRMREAIAAEVAALPSRLPEGWSVAGVKHSDLSASVYVRLRPANPHVPPFLLRISDHPQPRDRYRQVDLELGEHEQAVGWLSSPEAREALLWALDQYERGALRRTHTVREF